MSANKQHNEKDYSVFDRMSTAELKEILRRDSMMEGTEESDIDAIIYITEVVARREKETLTMKYSDVDAALKDFYQYYYPQSGAEIEEAAETAEKTNDIGTFPVYNDSTPGIKKKIRWKYVAIVAVLAVVLIGGSITAGALGFDVFGRVANWAQETFHFSNRPSDDPLVDLENWSEFPEQLQELQELLLDKGITQNIIPKYVPEGYEKIENKVSERPQYTKLYCLLRCEDNSEIIFSYILYEEKGKLIEKDPENEPEEYEVNGVTYYIMSNFGEYCADWSVDNIDCSIFGLSSREELIKMLDSI